MPVSIPARTLHCAGPAVVVVFPRAVVEVDPPEDWEWCGELVQAAVAPTNAVAPKAAVAVLAPRRKRRRSIAASIPTIG